MSTYKPPNDLYLTTKETQREVALYMFGQSKLSGESAADIQRRMAGATGGPNLLEFLGSLNVVREKYAHRFDFKPDATRRDKSERLRGLPDTIRQTIARNGVVEGDTVHAMREWQAMRGDKSRGLLLLGPAGCGKTLHASCLLMGSVLDVEQDGVFVGESVLSMHLTTGTKKDKGESLRPLQSAPLLVVDYMGQRKPQTGWESTIMEFMRMRWEAGRKCVLTFRGDLDQFKQTYGVDGWATVERFCTVLKVRRE